MNMLIRVVSCCFLFTPVVLLVNESCPSVGSYECIDVSGYGDRQYATCLTDSYIQTSSGNKHRCEDCNATNCWYPCMLDVHGNNDGEVTDDCSCNQLNTTAKQDLPPECYSPSGDECDWYTNCLQKRYPCKDNPASYAIEFAQRFCVLYFQHYPKFTSDGRSWIGAVRKCLQVKLVPSLRPGQENACDELRDFAFGTHHQCYVSPDGGENSVCDLTISDFGMVFWTLYQGFEDKDTGKTDDAMRSTFVHMLSVGSFCSEMWSRNDITDVIEFSIKANQFVPDDSKSSLWIDFVNRHRNTRSVTSAGNSVSDVVFKLTNQTSTTMRWKENHVMWFGYPVSVHNNNDTGNSTLIVRIVLASKGLYDLNAVNVPQANVSSVIERLSDAIANGDLTFSLGEYIDVALFKVCSDINCTTSTFETIPINYHPDTNNNEDGNSALLQNILIISFVVILCGIAGVIGYKIRK